ncbi:hypothetical protein [Streptomyces sp. C1-2]|uniref:hypothetical protein n=1 Tax=Streptomyces sp. C1-2 TaxID=2720022 RepID=UPI0014326822|nr:hypothetical protein [Streptomyces sp. C1-2]NJP71370.1 hypothetical protein [Streptomyces sp. C1-2]
MLTFFVVCLWTVLGALLVGAVVRLLPGGPPARRAAAAAGFLLCALALYLWGASHMFATDIEETCTLQHHQPLEPAYGHTSLVPLHRRCNAHFDLVPPYVNPGVVAYLVACACCLGTAVRARLVEHRSPAGGRERNTEAQ